jgi:hypothetical protein
MLWSRRDNIYRHPRVEVKEVASERGDPRRMAVAYRKKLGIFIARQYCTAYHVQSNSTRKQVAPSWRRMVSNGGRTLPRQVFIDIVLASHPNG